MKERPILFSGTMVRAILEDRKTQTRRIVKPQPREVLAQPGEGKAPSWAICNGPPKHTGVVINQRGNEEWLLCPYGRVGDRLWVRETWCPQVNAFGVDTERTPFYAADRDKSNLSTGHKWRPSIHMPRWASRITLEITGRRVERLQDISEGDAIREGISSIPDSDGPNKFTVRKDGWSMSAPTAKGVFKMLWEDINGDGSWGANPWVWVINFRRVK